MLDRKTARQKFVEETRLGIAKPKTFGLQMTENKHGMDNPVIDLNTSPISPGDQVSDLETPSGTVNGTNKIFTLAHTPYPSTSLHLYMNGTIMAASGVDYSLSGATITFVTAPLTGAILLASYTYSL